MDRGAQIAAIATRVREDAAARFDPHVDTTRWSWDGQLRVSGSVLVRSQAVAYQRAFRTGGFADPPSPTVETDLEREPTGLLHAAIESAGPLDLYRAPAGEDLQTQWVEPGPVRWFHAGPARSLVQLPDGTVGWVDTRRIGAPFVASADPWARWVRAPLDRTSAEPVDAGARAARLARARLGQPYRWGGNVEAGADCSGFVQGVVLGGLGLLLPKHTTDQRACGVRVPEGQIRPLDLIFVTGRDDRRNHVGLVLGTEADRTVIHACLSRARVIEEPLSAFLDRYRFLAVRRIVGQPPERETGTPESHDDPALQARAATTPTASMSEAAAGPAVDAVQALRGRRIHVVGASSAEGAELILFLAGQGLTTIVGHDFAPDAVAFARSFRRANAGWDKDTRENRLRALRRLPVPLHLGAEYLRDIAEAELIFASQNWFNYAPNLPQLPDAVARGVPLRGIVDLAMDLFPGRRIGVTGSNGKSTTAAWIRHLITQGLEGGRTFQGGNDRDRQVGLAELSGADPRDHLVWEVSNRHLRDRAVPVDIAVITQITANHIGDHGSFELYRDAKLRLIRALGEGGHAVLRLGDPSLERCAEELDAKVVRWWFGAGEPATGTPRGEGFVWFGGKTISVVLPSGARHELAARGFAAPGEHMRLNLAAALCAALAAGANPLALPSAWATLPALAGRIEKVAEQGGRRVFNDLSSTTPESTVAALQALSEDGRRAVLIVGGEDKGMDYGAMAEACGRCCPLVVVLPGTGSDRLRAVLPGGIDVACVAGVDEALDLAFAALRAGGEGLDLLLSPGMAFFQSRFLDEGPSFARRVLDRIHTL